MRVILVDDAALVREGIARLLADEGVDVVAQLPDASGLLDAVAAIEPDVVITDVRMPPTSTTEGLQAALEIKGRHPGVGVLVLSQHVEQLYARRLLADGSGAWFLVSEPDPDRLAAALPELPYACGLATVQLLTDDVATVPLLPVDGVLPVGGMGDEADTDLLATVQAALADMGRLFEDLALSQGIEAWLRATSARVARMNLPFVSPETMQRQIDMLSEERVAALVEAGVDVIVVDTAHGHAQGVLERVAWVKRRFPQAQVIGGNVGTADGAKALRDMLCAAGLSHPQQLGPEHILRRVSPIEVRSLAALYRFLEPGELIGGVPEHAVFRDYWADARSDAFTAPAKVSALCDSKDR